MGRIAPTDNVTKQQQPCHKFVMDAVIRQSAALPYRHVPGVGTEILLVTSRDTGRWVLPKGNIEAGENARTAALREATEEAGIWGEVAAESAGTYRYAKRRPDGSAPIAEVSVWPLRVLKIADDWAEAHQRSRIWLSPEDAARAVEEPELKRLLERWRG
jgi:uncharacterized protein